MSTEEDLYGSLFSTILKQELNKNSAENNLWMGAAQGINNIEVDPYGSTGSNIFGNLAKGLATGFLPAYAQRKDQESKAQFLGQLTSAMEDPTSVGSDTSAFQLASLINRRKADEEVDQTTKLRNQIELLGATEAFGKMNGVEARAFRENFFSKVGGPKPAITLSSTPIQSNTPVITQRDLQVDAVNVGVPEEIQAQFGYAANKAKPTPVSEIPTAPGMSLIERKNQAYDQEMQFGDGNETKALKLMDAVKDPEVDPILAESRKAVQASRTDFLKSAQEGINKVKIAEGLISKLTDKDTKGRSVLDRVGTTGPLGIGAASRMFAAASGDNDTLLARGTLNSVQSAAQQLAKVVGAGNLNEKEFDAQLAGLPSDKNYTPENTSIIESLSKTARTQREYLEFAVPFVEQGGSPGQAETAFQEMLAMKMDQASRGLAPNVQAPTLEVKVYKGDTFHKINGGWRKVK